MVLVHKLKQMEELDIEQFREPTDGDMSGVSSSTGSNPINPQKKHRRTTNQRKRQHSPPRRPTTRSQTGHLAKRKRHDEEDESEEEEEEPRHYRQNRPPAAPSATSQSLSLESSASLLGRASSAAGFDLAAQAATEDESGADAAYVPLPGQLTFLEDDLDPSSQDRRGPKSRAVHPVPIPNLTKKSRGRRVPTKTAVEKETTEKAGRLYVCKVEDCGKCFNRGEHLKRHIRSIHTHEKPFKCSHPACDKFFNRHDNLLQHLKVHKDLQLEQTARATHGPAQNLAGTSQAHGGTSVSSTIPTAMQSPMEAHPSSSMRTATGAEYYPPSPNPTTALSISSVRTAIDPVLNDPTFTGITPNMIMSGSIPPTEADVARARDLHDALGAVIQAIAAISGGPAFPTDQLAELTNRTTPAFRRKFTNETTPLGSNTPRLSPPLLQPVASTSALDNLQMPLEQQHQEQEHQQIQLFPMQPSQMPKQEWQQ